MASGGRIAVALVEEDLFGQLSGPPDTYWGLYLSLDGGKATSPLQVFRTLSGPGFEDTFALIIANGMPDSLVMTGQYLPHCDLTGYPSVSDLVGAWSYEHPKQAKVTCAGAPGNGLPNPIDNQIPGTQHPPGSAKLYGVGAYTFDGGHWGFNIDGAISFSCGNLPTLAIAWSLGSPHTNFAVTADLSAYSSDLQTFYDKTVGPDQSVDSDTKGPVKISWSNAFPQLEPDFVSKRLMDSTPWFCFVVVVESV